MRFLAWIDAEDVPASGVLDVRDRILTCQGGEVHVLQLVWLVCVEQ